jgi:hypothetical protein
MLLAVPYPTSLKFKIALLWIGLISLTSTPNTPIFAQTIASAKLSAEILKPTSVAIKPTIASAKLSVEILKPTIGSAKSTIASLTKNTVLLTLKQISVKPNPSALTPKTHAKTLRSASFTLPKAPTALTEQMLASTKEHSALLEQMLATKKDHTALKEKLLASTKEHSTLVEQMLAIKKEHAALKEKMLASTKEHSALLKEFSDSPLELPASKMASTQLFIKIKKLKIKALKNNKLCAKNSVLVFKIGTEKNIETKPKLLGYGITFHIRSPTGLMI